MAIDKVIYLGNEPYAASHDRWAALAHRSEGVLPADPLGDVRDAFKVSQKSGTANFSVDVSEGWVVVHGDDVENQGGYAAFNGAVLNVPHALGAPGSLPRVDRLVAQVNDSEHTARTPADQVTVRWEYGAPTSGATLENLSGAPAEPDSAHTLAYVLVQTSSSNITDDRIKENRVPSAPVLYGEDGSPYRLGVDAEGKLGLEALA